MKLPIIAEYVWTEDEYLDSQHQHAKTLVRRPFLYLLYSVSGIVAALGILSLIKHGMSVSAVMLTVTGFYFLILRRYETRYFTKRRFRQSPGCNKRVCWQFQEEVVLLDVEATSEARMFWSAFGGKVIRTPKGILLYPSNNSLYYWLPTKAFAEPADLDALWGVMREKGLQCQEWL